MKEKYGYVAPNMEIVLYSVEDIVCTSKPDLVRGEVGEPWDEGWDE